MSISALLQIYVDCDSTDPDINCHVSIKQECNFVNEIPEENAHEEWLIENGWLPLGELAYCPVCKKQLM